MPELPEVETIRRVLNHRLAGLRLLSCSFVRMEPWNPHASRRLSYIFHPFKETPPPAPFRSTQTYTRVYRRAFLLGLASFEQKLLTDVIRRGKYLIFNFKTSTNHPHQLVTHLRMAGKFLLNPETVNVKDPKEHIHLVLRLGKVQQHQQTLVYTDTRFGEILQLLPPSRIHAILKAENLSPKASEQYRTSYEQITAALTRRLGRIGLEPLTGIAALKIKLHSMLEHYTRIKSTATLHRVLLDGSQIAGIGNIYANEICHRAGLHPLRNFIRLTPLEARQLARAIFYILSGAVKRRGTSLDHTKSKSGHADQSVKGLSNNPVEENPGPSANHFRLPDGSAGTYAHVLQVYGCAGEICSRKTCSGTIARMVEQGRSVYACSDCQH